MLFFFLFHKPGRDNKAACKLFFPQQWLIEAPNQCSALGRNILLNYLWEWTVKFTVLWDLQKITGDWTRDSALEGCPTDFSLKATLSKIWSRVKNHRIIVNKWQVETFPFLIVQQSTSTLWKCFYWMNNLFYKLLWTTWTQMSYKWSQLSEK